jgi:hypothetical protein
LVFAVAAGLQQAEHDGVLGLQVRRFGREPFGVGFAENVDVVFERLQILDVKADVVQAGPFVLGAQVVFDLPRRENQRDFAVGEIEVRIFERLRFIFKLVNVDVERRQLFRIRRPQSDVFDPAFLGARAVEPDASALS